MPVNKDQGFGDRKTFIRRKYFCRETDRHGGNGAVWVELKKYRTKQYKKRKIDLYICPKCNTLYYKSDSYCVPMLLGNESTLISNIDSPSDTIKCRCGKNAFLANVSGTEKKYLCLDCFSMTVKSDDGIDIFPKFE